MSLRGSADEALTTCLPAGRSNPRALAMGCSQRDPFGARRGVYTERSECAPRDDTLLFFERKSNPLTLLNNFDAERELSPVWAFNRVDTFLSLFFFYFKIFLTTRRLWQNTKGGRGGSSSRAKREWKVLG